MTSSSGKDGVTGTRLPSFMKQLKPEQIIRNKESQDIGHEAVKDIDPWEMGNK